MFERAIPLPVSAPVAEGPLRQVDWHELVARLAAARDLRLLFARAETSGGSFAPERAAGIAGPCASEPGVNLGALSTGKREFATIAAATPGVDHGDQDTE